MATQSTPLLTLSLLAAAALPAHRFVTHTGAVPAAGAAVAGVNRAAAATGDLTPVDVLGTTIVEASAAIAVGAAVETIGDGRAVTKTTGVLAARALQAAAAAGDLIEVLLIPN